MLPVIESKICYECDEEKSITEGFYAHKQMDDGYVNICKECHKRRMAKRYSVIMSTVEGIQKERKRTRERYHRLNYRVRQNRVRQNRIRRSHKAKKPTEKSRARDIISNAIRDKRIIPPKECENCGHDFSFYRREAHHKDYNKPLEVIWLCSLCHGIQHRKIDLPF